MRRRRPGSGPADGGIPPELLSFDLAGWRDPGEHPAGAYVRWLGARRRWATAHGIDYRDMHSQPITRPGDDE